MRVKVALLVLLSLGFICAQSTRETFPEVKCSDIQPLNCYDERRAVPNCTPERVQTWLPQNNIGIPATCGACYYCQPYVVETSAVDCPEAVCPEIAPTCNSVVPRTRFLDGRRCRDCSTCLSYNVCPELDCPTKIRRCEVTGPNFEYINGQLCQVCDICTRFKTRQSTGLERGPLPCPEFDIEDCGISSKCKVYQDRFANMGSGRRCQVCPECIEWRDPNDRIPTSTPQSPASAPAVMCADIDSCPPQGADCLETAPVHRFLDGPNGERCRLCNICVHFDVNPNDDQIENTNTTTTTTTTTTSTTTPTPTTTTQDCPTLTSCPSTSSCSRNVKTRYTLIITGERCQLCNDCQSNMNACPLIRCPNEECLETEIITETNSQGAECQLCECKRFRPRGGPELGNDADRPAITTTTTNTPTTTTGRVAVADIGDDSGRVRPACSQVIPEIRCETLDQLDCTVTIQDTLTINGTECRSCHRCLQDNPTSCPTLQCPNIQCGDREDVVTGRRYRKAVKWEVSGRICDGCEECLSCDPPTCPPYDVDCMAYEGTTDDIGCPLCPYCTNWRNNVPNVRERQGFFQGATTALCVEADRTPRPNQNHIFVNQCSFLDSLSSQRQVWTYHANGTFKEMGGGQCLKYNPSSEKIEMAECDTHDLNFVWLLEKGTRYVQFFRMVHHTTNKCLNAVGNGLKAYGTGLELATCESFSVIDGEWSDQWFQFQQYHSGSVQETQRTRG